MYQKSRFGNSRSFSGRNNYQPKRNNFNNSRRRMKFFDPSHLMGKATVSENQESSEYVAKNSFNDFQINDKLKENIVSHDYKTPTPIQDQAIPVALKGTDVIGMAKTGTGKTAAFLIPLINKVFQDRNQKVLIITPTRELAVQIEAEFKEFAKNLNIFSVLCIGGVGMGNQIWGLRKNSNFVIGTPGRLLDLEKQRKINFREYSNIVLDEVDRILDMGFIENLKYILERLPENRQSFFFSATMPPKVESVARSFLKNPFTISIKSNAPSTNIDQSIVKIGGKPKIEVLHDLLIKDGFDKVLVFGRTKHGIEKLFYDLQDRGFKVEAIHGNKSQNQRQRALDNFKKNYVQVLLATDIVARGIDISDITHVINYDLPESYEDYIHRIGRTGRADKKGIALTLVN